LALDAGRYLRTPVQMLFIMLLKLDIDSLIRLVIMEMSIVLDRVLRRLLMRVFAREKNYSSLPSSGTPSIARKMSDLQFKRAYLTLVWIT
jgi:hypothetical protein